MIHPALPDFFAIAMVFVLAGAVKGVLGLGLPTVAIGLLGLFMPVAPAAALLTVPSLVTNVWQAAAGPQFAALSRRLWGMLLGTLAGVAVVAVFFSGAATAWGRQLLGVCLLVYGGIGLAGWRPRPLPGRLQGPIGVAAGFASGVLTGFSGVFVLPAVPYLQSLSLDKRGLSQAMGLCFTTSTVALAAALAWQGHLDLRASTGSLVMVAPALAGMWLGQALRDAMSEAAFRRTLFAGLALLGGWMLAR
ncbi:sulfite exporter TauE/SafE family protein [Ramlibacter humi]|uniref:sulfite exporter TauE/SafE family protein n=1 Tax=Ramlibacter humi TaxID=2530451 RepID=UPI001EF028B4|nr:sulfite exporter TauE/SafE family protein [Ramlibacter humi]